MEERKVVELTDKNFLNTINNERVYVLDFYADWCQPCKPVAKLMEDLAVKYSDVKFFKINVDNSQSAASYFGVSGLPTVLIVYCGEVRSTIFADFKTKLDKEVKKYSSCF